MSFRSVVHAAVFAGVLFACVIIGMVMLEDPAYATVDGKPVVISLGDSYSSGEGTEPFYEQEHPIGKYSKDDWLAHRSKHAWPGKLVVNGTELSKVKDASWLFVASSGAKTEHVMGDGKDPDGDDYGAQWKTWGIAEEVVSHSHPLPCQAKAFDRIADPNTIDYVTLTIGGNDLGFASVVSDGVCESLKGDVRAVSNIEHQLNRWSIWGYVKDIPGLRAGTLQRNLQEATETFKKKTLKRLASVYGTVLGKSGDNATLIVAGYPHLFPGVGRLPFINSNEAVLINSAVDTFDTEVRRMIENRGEPRIVFADPRPYFSGREALFINNIMLGPRSEDLLRFAPVSDYSVHPNKYGQTAYAHAVQDVIDTVEQRRASFQAKPVASKDVDVESDVGMSLVFDVSGSMTEDSAMSGQTKLESAKKQSTDFVSSVNGEKNAEGGLSVRVGVCSFANGAQENCGLSNNPDDINASINSLDADGQTNMYAGLAAGMDQLMGEDGPRLIVFLSDGLSNVGGSREEILDLAQKAAEEDIRVYTIGFGPSDSLDEDLLSEIADITGGTYSHEDSTSISSAAVGLFATMMNARLEASSQVLSSTVGAVGQDETSQAGSFDITKNGTVQIYLYWPGSVLDMRLTDPSGKQVGEGYAGYSADTSTIPTSITIQNAKQGAWNMEVYGREVSMTEEPYYAVASFDETEAPASASNGGGAANNGEGLLFLALVAAVACIGGAFAYTKRRAADGKK